MARQHIEIVHDFAAPVDRVFAFLSEHEKLGVIFRAVKIGRGRDGHTERNGVGSVRTLKPKIGLWPTFEETVTAYRANELIEYKITKRGPLKNHCGTMRFSAIGVNGARLHYVIVFESVIPFAGAFIRWDLEQGIRKGLAKLRL